jgi:predicted nucleic acid-binding protein
VTKGSRVARAKGATPRATARVRERPTERRASEDNIRYVETSALLAAALEGDASAQRALRGSGRLITSSLTHAEAARAVVRARATGRISPTEAHALAHALSTFAQRCETVIIDEQILGRVGRSFPIEPVRTLDAIHLATVETLGAEPGSVTVVTRDTRVRENARALGWSTE